jgi:membrane-associated phospholipid phosphatase
MPPTASRPSPPVHEWIFATPLALIAAHLVLRHSLTHPGSLFFLVLLALFAVIAWRDRTAPSSITQWLRLAALPIATVATYFRLGLDVQSLTSFRADTALLHLDRAFFGETPAITLVPLRHPALTELLSLCYFGFYLALIGYHVAWIQAGFVKARPFFAGVYSIYGIGFIGYILLPASGPWHHSSLNFPSPPEGGLITLLNHWVVQTGCNGVDVFPSLHCAVTVFMVGYDLTHGHLRRFTLALLPALGLCLSTLYLGYHYAVDVIAGIFIAGLALVATRP